MKYLDAFMSWLGEKLRWLPQLGFDKSWTVGGKVVYLWPFVAVALTLLIVWGLNELLA